MPPGRSNAPLSKRPFDHSDISPFRIKHLPTVIDAKVICALIVP